MLIRAPHVDPPSAGAVDRAKIALDRALGVSKVDTTLATRESFQRDESEAIGLVPDVVVHAKTRDDIAKALTIANDSGVPITPRAGGTGRTGGAVPVAGGIVLDTAGMNDVKEVNADELVCVVQPGVVTGELHALLEKEGLFYPPDPNSLKSCMIGGNVAENAGGPRAFKYGVTREYVLGLEAVTMSGDVLKTGKRTVKGVTGYDVTALLVGSEGTLAVFTEVTLRVVRKPEEVATVLALFGAADAAARAVSDIIASGLVPRCVEMMDARTLDAIRAQKVAVDTRAGAMLLIEVDGVTGETNAMLERLGERLTGAPGVLDVMVAQDAAQRDRLWEARRMLSPATRKLAKYKLSEDIVVPRNRIARLLEIVDDIGRDTKVQHLTYGHAGDGNFHVNFLWNDDAEREAVDRALLSLMKATVQLGGTLTGEHGVGVLKAEYLPLEQSPALIAVQKDIKRVFDPKGLLNPGKIFPSTGHKAC
jgi:glycolate oxidase